MTVTSRPVTLEWPNKHLRLEADGATGYRWVVAEALDKAPRARLVGGPAADTDTGTIICADALDAERFLLSGQPVIAEPVRLLYVDPPFNTGRSFGDYEDSLQTASWLSMMRDRLEGVKPLLASDASVWVHLDDSQVHHARVVLDEVFGSNAFVATLVWQKRTTRESRSAFSNNHDYIHVYAPAGPRSWKKRRNLLVKDEAVMRNRDNDTRGPWVDAPFTAPGFRNNQHYDIITPAGSVIRPPRGRSWYATEGTFRNLMADNRIWFPRGGSGSPRLKLFPHQLRGLVPFSVWSAAETGTNDDAKRHLQRLFADAGSVFMTPKPEELLERIVHVATDPGEVVMDLFAGSGTTASVAHKMGRKWVAVERSAATVVKVLEPRLRQVINGADPGGVTALHDWRGGGSFSVWQVQPAYGRVGAIRLSKKPARAIIANVGEERTAGRCSA